jgi:maltose alpha-D-glucosyltransferase/alpha-amylase
MKRAIALRKQHKVFGRGKIEFLSPQNRKILVYVRYDDTEIILVMANLSRHVQPVELDLTAYRGMVPREMFGRTEFPPIGDAPYFASLGPHAFYWFELLPAPAPVLLRTDTGEGKGTGTSLPVLRVADGWDTLFTGAAQHRLETDVLPSYLTRQRWFGGKARTILRVRVIDHAVLHEANPPLWHAMIEVAYNRGLSGNV